jgi:hypothetical protein
MSQFVAEFHRGQTIDAVGRISLSVLFKQNPFINQAKPEFRFLKILSPKKNYYIKSIILGSGKE